MSIDPTPHLGERRVVTTHSAVTLTGEILSGPEDMIGIDVGIPVYLRMQDVDAIGPVSEAPRRADGSHLLSAGQAAVDDQNWTKAVLAHEAAHAVIARVLGITVTYAYVSGDRTTRMGGGVDVEGGDAQHRAVQLAAGPIAHARRLRELGAATHPLTEAAVEMIGGQADHAKITQFARDGYVLWRRQAEADAALLLDQPRIWEAILALGRALEAAGATGMDQAQIDAAIGDPATLATHRVWTPVVLDT